MSFGARSSEAKTKYITYYSFGFNNSLTQISTILSISSYSPSDTTPEP